MTWKRKLGGGLLATIGFMLSPLSWWNDLFVNIPLALLFAWMVSAVYEPAFEASLIIGYWATNVLGFVLMHQGLKQFISREASSTARRELVKDIIISLLYTFLIVLLVKWKVFAPLEEYFRKS